MEILKANLDYGLFALLGAMSFLVIAYGLERHLFFRRVDLTRFGHADQLSVALTAHLTTIASVGANAPYVGLLGTVLGILITFHDLGDAQHFDTGQVMRGLALALKATALGLVVAIPSILIYNGLLRRVEVLTARWRVSRGEA